MIYETMVVIKTPNETIKCVTSREGVCDVT